MCSLCGVIGGNEHWADAAARPGIYTRMTDTPTRRRERAKRISLANRVLSHWRLTLSDWQGTSFLLSTATGRTEIVEDLGHLWSTAERLLGRPCDPLDEALVARLEAEGG